jgi:hypothetical protein
MVSDFDCESWQVKSLYSAKEIESLNLPLPIVKLMLLPLFDVVLLVMTLDYPTGVSTGCKEDIIITKISEVTQ